MKILRMSWREWIQPQTYIEAYTALLCWIVKYKVSSHHFIAWSKSIIIKQCLYNISDHAFPWFTVSGARYQFFWWLSTVSNCSDSSHVVSLCCFFYNLICLLLIYFLTRILKKMCLMNFDCFFRNSTIAVSLFSHRLVLVCPHYLFYLSIIHLTFFSKTICPLPPVVFYFSYSLYKLHYHNKVL
jgi:hypothetical protein